MSYTLNDFIHEPNVPKMKQLTNCKGFGNIKIQSVSVQEFPFDDFIKENELVLSTAIGWEHNPNYFKQLIETAGKSHAAAILFAFVDTEVTISKDAIELAERLNLPLFEIPWEYRFSDIQSIVYKSITNEKQIFWQNLQNKLCNLFFESESLDRACDLIGKEFHCKIAVLDQLGKALGQSDEDLEWLLEEAFMQKDIMIRNIIFGKLCMDIKNESVMDLESLEKAVIFPLSLWFNQKSFEDSLKEKLKNEFVCNLATDNYSSFEEMMQQGLYLHFDLSVSYACVVLKSNEILSEGNPNVIMEVRSQIENILLRIGENLHVKTMLCYLNHTFVVYVESKPEEAFAYVEAADTLLSQKFTYAEFYWGISEVLSEKNTYSELYNHAALALQYSLTSKKESHIFTYQATRKELIVSCLSDSESICEAAKMVMDELLEYDKSSSVNLMETLVVYLNCNYNISKTARELSIHRQSLLYRLEKIENLTGMKLDCHENLFVLEVFSRIYKDY